MFGRATAGDATELVDPVIFPWAEERDIALRNTVDEASGVMAVPAERSRGADVGLLLARIVLGGVAVLGGARVLFDLPAGSGGGLRATATMLAGHGFWSTELLARTLGWAQLAAGVLVLLGVFASFAASALLAVAVTAVGVTVPVAVAAGTTGPVEAPLLAAALGAVVVLAGPGRVAGDAGRPWARRQTPVGLTCLTIGVATGLTVLFAFR